jgi:hypothetical protein
LCGSLAEGRDGVGDYTIGLANEAAQAGVAVSAIALCDPHISTVVSEMRVGVPILRIPSCFGWRKRAKHLGRALDKFDPLWISLQFVAYAFDPRGLPVRFGSWLRNVAGSNRMLEVMMHELWIGGLAGAPIKQRVVGAAQRFIIKRLFQTLDPAVVHTSNSAYVELLRRGTGREARLLPLFGSIPCSATGMAESPLHTVFKRIGLAEANRDEFWLFGIFGSVHREWNPREFFARLLPIAAARNRRVVLIAIGKAHDHATSMLKEIESAFFGEQLKVFQIGEQPAEAVAQCFADLDFGLAASPWQLIGKSSAAIAMLEHGLPVIAIRDDVQLPFPIDDPGADEPLLIKVGPDLEQQLDAVRRQPPQSRRPRIVKQWLKELSEVEAPAAKVK